ncbi:DUF2306 domain-containing protein [Terribacillus saccharophilus]|uniref:DUF2306 domain-containing protein n=1 Tax=Terribacillus saccharophilus TaxID=361277 RepID=A0ABX4GYL5_9BACI|nr:DUF2306 domain-containing protein [Terribacillus saccharophilus]PAD35739.1 hypothetical protein CHH56_07980 [Terribacillus saccharophilus]PAD96395.1 hypothetical protein CHH50_08575 [Terribacillus saccharophilus]PAD99970.1 hypothetical protein CHH48_09480 [Terribacillus saccharophilus]
MILKRIRLGVVTLLAVGIAGYSVVQYGFVGLDKAGMVMQKISSGEVLSDMWRIMLSIHIATSIFALVLGPFLLLDSIRQKNKVLHKRMGYIYTAGVIGGGITGLYLAYYASGGTFAKIGFALMAITWLVTVFFAVKAAIQKKIAQHRRWTMVNYSMTFAAVTLRIWLGMFMFVFGPALYGVYYAYTAWLSWVPNILIMLVYLQRKKSFSY